MLLSAGEKAPRLLLRLAKAQTDKGDLEAAEKTLDRAAAMISKGTMKNVRAEIECQRALVAVRRGDPAGIKAAYLRAERELPKRAHRKVRSLALRAGAHAAAYADRDLERAEQLAAEAVELLEGAEEQYSLAAALVDLSFIQAERGNTLAAHATDMRAHELLMEIGAPLPLATSFNNLAFAAHMRGHYEEALDLFSEGLKFARQAASPVQEALIQHGQADVFNDLGLAFQAAELYGEALRIAARLENGQLIRYGCLQTSVLHRRRGAGDLPHQWLERAMALGGVAEGVEPPPDVRLQLAALEIDSDPKEALRQLDRLLKDDEDLDLANRTLALYLRSKALYADSEMGRAKEAAQDALACAGGNGTEQILAAELMPEGAFRDFLRRTLLGNPVMATVTSRIDTMAAVAQQYQDQADLQPQSPRLIFKALGKVELQRGRQRIEEFKPLTREILFFLLEHGRVDRDVIAETFWPENPPGKQTSNLYTAVYSLRRTLGKDAVLLDGQIYELNPELPVEYDVERFERAASIAEGLPQGDPRRFFALTEATNSYGGRFLPEFDSEWVLERRRDLEIRFLELLLAHAEEGLVRNQPLRAVASLRRALGLDPYRDDIHMRYLETLGLLERRSEIVAHYQQYVQMLATELGLDPPEAVRDLYTKLIG
jgi:DNA-binding SARP family transcriptional activator